MHTCLQNNLINEALQLDMFVKELIETQLRHSKTMASNQPDAQQRAVLSPTHAALAATAGASTGSGHSSSALSAVLNAPGIPSLLLTIQSEVDSIKLTIVNNLLSQLKGGITVETGFPIVGLLKRTLDVFNAPTTDEKHRGAQNMSQQHGQQSVLLKFQFLLSRNTYFEQALAALSPPQLPTESATDVGQPGSVPSQPSSVSSTFNAALFKFLDEYLYLHRTNLFDILTLYSALFLDHDEVPNSLADGSESNEAEDLQQQQDLGLLCRWVHYRIEIMMKTLET
jgi:hypothetical protein